MPLRYPLEKTMQANKTIHVVDSVGNRYEATYLKRAKGLVKHGRARFIDEHTICLACPPNTSSKNETEDIIMSEAIKNTENTISAENTQPTSSQYTVEYILGEIAEIRKQTAYLNTCISELAKVKSEGPEDIGAQAKAQAIADIVKCRETTNQQMLHLYEKMYDSLTVQGQKEPMSKWNAITKLADAACIEGDSDETAEARAGMIAEIRQILKENK